MTEAEYLAAIGGNEYAAVDARTLARILAMRDAAAPQPPTAETYTTNAIAKLYHCGTQRIASAMRRAGYKPIRVGQAHRYPAEAVKAVAPYLAAPLT